MDTDDTGAIATPDRRLRVFVSSTLEELAPERQAARRAVEGLHLVPVMFELGARPHPPQALYRAYLEQSDVFVGIYGRSYGWVGPGMDISGLEDEFRLASGKPRLLYVRRETSPRDPGLERLLESIRAEGEVSYKQFDDAHELAQLIADDLAIAMSEQFVTPVRQRQTGRNTSIPAEPNALVGREREVADVCGLLRSDDVRLVTIVGTGGVGKTRIATRVARTIAFEFHAGARFIPLAGIRDGSLLAATIASAVGVRNVGPTSTVEALVDELRDTAVLLVLDNFEQLVDAADVIADLLEGAPLLKVLATSREPLRLLAEHEYPLAPFASPARYGSIGELETYDAVQLFLARARAACRDFVLDDSNAPAIAKICRRVDGIALAIELAAVRLRAMPPAVLADRLERGFDVLSSGHRDLPDRQRTLRATIDWSYSLLTESERRLLRTLSVFEGGFPMSGASEICGDDIGIDVFDGIAALVEKSLLRLVNADADPRFDMLEPIREYMHELLVAADECEAINERHAAWIKDVVAQSYAGTRSEYQREWVVRLHDEIQNVRAALRWLIQRGDADGAGAILWALWLPAWISGQLEEGRDLARATLACSQTMRLDSRARLLTGLGMFSLWLGDNMEAAATIHEALELAREIDDDAALSHALVVAALIAAALSGEEEAKTLFDEALTIAKRGGDAWIIAAASAGLGWMYVGLDEHDDVGTVFEDTLAAAQLAGDDVMLGMAEENLAEHLMHLGRRAEARPLLSSALHRFRSVRAVYPCTYAIDDVARDAHGCGRNEAAAMLLGASEALRERIGAPVWASAKVRRERLVGAVRSSLGDETFDARQDRGRALTFSNAIATALEALKALELSEAPSPLTTVPPLHTVADDAIAADAEIRDLSEEELVARIAELREAHNAVILAHNYQISAIQDIADFVGDSLELARQAAATNADVIVFCGVHFMAETAALLSPNRRVLIPDPEAGCSLAQCVRAEDVRKWRIAHPEGVVVAYVNTDADVKAESDYCCTSSNAVEVVHGIEPNREILFLPDQFLGMYVERQAGRELDLWMGECHVHAAIRPADVDAQLAAHPGAHLLLHPECGCASQCLWRLAEGELPASRTEVLSTSGMVHHARECTAPIDLVGTEVGMLHRLRKENQTKQFIPLREDAVCSYMKTITLQKLYRSLRDGEYVVTVDEPVAGRARRVLEQMVNAV